MPPDPLENYKQALERQRREREVSITTSTTTNPNRYRPRIPYTKIEIDEDDKDLLLPSIEGTSFKETTLNQLSTDTYTNVQVYPRGTVTLSLDNLVQAIKRRIGTQARALTRIICPALGEKGTPRFRRVNTTAFFNRIEEEIFQVYFPYTTPEKKIKVIIYFTYSKYEK